MNALVTGTLHQRCFRVDRLSRELVHELRAHAYFDRGFGPAKAMAEETHGAIMKVCKETRKLPAIRAYSKSGSKKRKKSKKKRRR